MWRDGERAVCECVCHCVCRRCLNISQRPHSASFVSRESWVAPKTAPREHSRQLAAELRSDARGRPATRRLLDAPPPPHPRGNNIIHKWPRVNARSCSWHGLRRSVQCAKRRCRRLRPRSKDGGHGYSAPGAGRLRNHHPVAPPVETETDPLISTAARSSASSGSPT